MDAAAERVFLVLDVCNLARSGLPKGESDLNRYDLVLNEIRTRWPSAIVHSVADSSFRWDFPEGTSERERIERLLGTDPAFEQTRVADTLCLDYARIYGGYVVTNDMYRDHAPEYPDLIPDRLLRCDFVGTAKASIRGASNVQPIVGEADPTTLHSGRMSLSRSRSTTPAHAHVAPARHAQRVHPSEIARNPPTFTFVPTQRQLEIVRDAQRQSSQPPEKNRTPVLLISLLVAAGLTLACCGSMVALGIAENIWGAQRGSDPRADMLVLPDWTVDTNNEGNLEYHVTFPTYQASASTGLELYDGQWAVSQVEGSYVSDDMGEQAIGPRGLPELSSTSALYPYEDVAAKAPVIWVGDGDPAFLEAGLVLEGGDMLFVGVNDDVPGDNVGHFSFVLTEVSSPQ